MKVIVYSLCLFLLCLCPGLAEDTLTATKLRSLGINASTLQPITFNHDDSVLVAFDRAPFSVKKQGIFHRLWFFDISSDGNIGDVHQVDLPLKSVQQGEFSSDDEHFVVVGERGTTFLSVDTKTHKTETLLEPAWGHSGFRAEPAVLWSESGKLFVIGHPYDEQRFIESRTVATLNLSAADGKFFTRGPDISSLEKSLDRLWFTNYVTDQSAFFGQKYPQTTILSYWNGETTTEFDRAWKYLGFWGNAGRLLFSVRRTETADCELGIFDSQDNQIKKLQSSEKDFRYLFLSRDGGTLLTTQVSDTEGRLEPLFARESDQWELKPAVLDTQGNPRTIAAGWMRLSSAGRLMCHIGATGLTIYSL